MISPVGISFAYWIHSLTVDFPSDIIPVVTDDKDWIRICNIIASSPSFAKVSVPSADMFPSWNKWAERVYGLLG